MADLKGFNEKYGLNSRLVKHERQARRGGLQDRRPLRQADRRDRQASRGGDSVRRPSRWRRRSRALIQWYRTGDDADRAKYDIAWVQDKASPVDTINGFIEVYLDPRGIKGALGRRWSSTSTRRRPQRIQKLADNAQWFEDHMPWDPKYRKPSVQGIVANAIDVVVETGDSGPVTPIGINLPNDQAIREQYGSKSVSLSNVNEAYDKSTPGTMRSEFSWTPEEAERAAKFARRSAAS